MLVCHLNQHQQLAHGMLLICMVSLAILALLQLDLVAKEPGDAPPTVDFKKLLTEMSSNCSYADLEAVKA
jgi:hypothetical protein